MSSFTGKCRLKNLALVLTAVVVTACASNQPAPPAKTLTAEERDALWEQNIQKAIGSAYIAGKDGAAVGEDLHRNKCLYYANATIDVDKRSAAIAQCRIDWPARSVVNTSCVNYGSEVRCSSQ
jgi:hypothetical protein